MKMNMRLFIRIFVVVAIGSLLLALAGKFLLQWNDRAVGIWTGIGAGYLLGAIGMRLMPRWYREHMDDEYAQPAGQRYARAIMPILALYSVTLVGSIWLIKRGIESMPFRAMVAIIPAFSILLIMWAALRYFREADELQRRIEAESIGVACLVVSFVYFAGGLLQKAKVIDVPSADAMIWVFPMTMAVYGFAKFAAVRRYR